MIIKYIIAIVVGYVISSISITVLTVLRFGIPLCNILIKNKEEDEDALKLLRKKYCISLLIWLPIIILVTLLCYKFLGNGFYVYLATLVLMLLIGFRSTSNTESNMQEFYTSLKSQESILLTKKIESEKKYQENVNKIINQLTSKKAPPSDNALRIQEIVSNSQKLNNILEGKETIETELFINSKNPYTNKKINNYDDVIEYLNMYKLDSNNIDPLTYIKK